MEFKRLAGCECRADENTVYSIQCKSGYVTFDNTQFHIPNISYVGLETLLSYHNEVWCVVSLKIYIKHTCISILIYFVVKTFKIYACMYILIYFVVKTLKINTCMSILINFYIEGMTQSTKS